jgi:hypothetical protein
VTSTRLNCTSGLSGPIGPCSMGKAIDRLVQIDYISV